ncbi:aflatoxin B1 aldehyde reductase member 3 [Diaporthe helianthi]|uniref:Aflatoxin B1 aldehyde reductase member 3 n=1 Tax=Diaporthe helianthi TaxID=158607 RepID=A0A2P5I8F2_DIAHE|nr:aflatoxin B1 aldehyde reductase member 3 [Diaporthe helianthi]
MSTSDLKLAVGTLSFAGAENLQPALDATKAAGIKEIDTAEIYGNNEADLGSVGAAEEFTISTKNPGGWKPGTLQELTTRFDASLARLKTKSVDILYVHAPDRDVALDDWVPQVDALHKGGKFRRFGVSNFTAEETRALYGYALSRGYVLPTVYQGNYNAVSRLIEATLFPTLRELGIAFYAYSPVAGGFLTKTRVALEGGTADGRFRSGDDTRETKVYRGFYCKPKLLEGLGRWEELAEVQGVPRAELAYRWVYYHSALRQDKGDVVIVGASRPEQITQTAEGIRRGPLKPEVVKGIEEVWELVKGEAIVDNFDALVGKLPSQ